MSPPPASSVADRLRGFGRKLAQAARLAIGIPDYQNYVAHRRMHHPGEPVMSQEAFVRERLESRYRRGSSRCC
jgi:uncharacterized short protein YbdD (DUF466 family)